MAWRGKRYPHQRRKWADPLVGLAVVLAIVLAAVGLERAATS
jgi:hypothetical protein